MLCLGYTEESSIRRAKPASLAVYSLAQLGGKGASMRESELSTAATPGASGYGVTHSCALATENDAKSN